MGYLQAPGRVQTERLVPRIPIPDDAPVIFERYARDPEVTRYLTWTPQGSIDRTYEFLRWCDAARQAGEVGYVLARRLWHHGYMTEALRTVVAWALAQPECCRVWAVCDVEHHASARVREQAGFHREGTSRRWSVHPNVSAEPRARGCYAGVK